ncbi:MAG: DMT family transporter [bacterium]
MPAPPPLPFDSNRPLAMAAMIVSSVTISFSGLVVRSIEAAEPWQINFYRSIALLGVVGGWIVFRFGRDSLGAIANIGALGVVAGVLLGGAGMAFLQALTHTTVANTLFILGAIPFFAALVARVALKERLSRETVVTMLVAAAGLSVMVAEGVAIGVGAGNAFALLTALLFALYAVILRSRRQREMLPSLLISALLIIVVSGIIQAGDLAISLYDLTLCFIWGGLLSGSANWLFIYASRHLAAAEVTLFLLLEFALGPLWVWLAINEQPSRWTLIGGALIILAVAVRAAVELRGARLGRGAR